MTLTKEKNNTQKQRTVPNDERPSQNLILWQTGINQRIAKKWHAFLIRRRMRHSCDRAFERHIHRTNKILSEQGHWALKLSAHG